MLVVIIMMFQAIPLHILADFRGHWAESSIDLLRENNIILGDENGNINPDNFITRAEFTAIVNRTFEFNETSDNNFIDVSPNSWYYQDFSIAKNLGFIMGDENGMANPESNIRRVEVALILARVLGLESIGAPNFLDHMSIPSWGINAVSAMQEYGLIRGYVDGSFRPLDDITRAEAFTIIANIIRSREEAIETASTAPNFVNVSTVRSNQVSDNNSLDDSSNDIANNNQGGGNMPPTNPPAPPSLPPTDGSNPTIIIHTEFPSGEVTQSYIDIEYTATPSQGAVITEIFYRTNDGAEDFIYIGEVSGFTPMGELGRARVFIRPDENNIVFTVRDSAGREGHFTVDATPTLSWLIEYERDEEIFKTNPRGHEFVANMLLISAQEGVTREQVEEAIATIDGRIITVRPDINHYSINLPPHEYEELRTIIEHLETEFSDIIRRATINGVGTLGSVPTNDPWWTDRRFPFRSTEWGFSAIRVPEAWNFLQTQETREVRIGIVDGGVRYTHEDLQIPRRNIFNRQSIAGQNHGTHVMGIIGAIHNNELGLAGVVNTSRNNLFSYDVVRGFNARVLVDDVIDGFRWNIINGVKVINFSLGGENLYDPETLDTMSFYLNRGYDFVVMQAAGNDASNANNSSLFRTHTLPENDPRRQRVITVGGTNRRGNIAPFSDYGTIIDILAPSVDIYSTWAGSDDDYYITRGTSQATPHVAGVVALVWSLDRGFTGAQVRDIVRDSGGLTIFDDRSSVPENHRLTYHQVDALTAVQIARNVNPQRTTGQLAGKILPVGANVLDQGIENARVTIQSNMYFPETTVEFFAEEFTDSDGYFFIQNIPAGAYSVEITANSFAPVRTTIFVEVGVTTRITELLDIAPIVLDRSFRIEFITSEIAGYSPWWYTTQMNIAYEYGMRGATYSRYDLGTGNFIKFPNPPNPQFNILPSSNSNSMSFNINSLQDGRFEFEVSFAVDNRRLDEAEGTIRELITMPLVVNIYNEQDELVTSFNTTVISIHWWWRFRAFDIIAENGVYRIVPVNELWFVPV